MLAESHPESISTGDIGTHSLKHELWGDFAAEEPTTDIWQRESWAHPAVGTVQKESRFLQGARAQCQTSGRHTLATLTQASWGARNSPKFGAKLTFVPGPDCALGTNRICIRGKMSEKATVQGVGRGKDWENCSGKKKHSCCSTPTTSNNVTASLLAAD